MRYTLMDIIETVNDIIIYNPLSIEWDKFTFTNGYYTHVLTQQEVERFWLIPFAYYGDTKFDDILLILNDVENIFELKPGATIVVPKIEDLREFILDQTKVRK